MDSKYQRSIIILLACILGTLSCGLPLSSPVALVMCIANIVAILKVIKLTSSAKKD